MSDYQHYEGIAISARLKRFVDHEILPGLDIQSDNFWRGFANMVVTHAPKNRALLDIRQKMQCQIDDWHKAYGSATAHMPAYIAYLRQIGYIEPEVADFTIETANCDAEITTICGPQLVVPADNARYLLNAANARWGSLYDALYGTDVIDGAGEIPRDQDVDPRHATAVFAYAADFLDRSFSLKEGSHIAATGYRIEADHLIVTLKDGQETDLLDSTALLGWCQDSNRLIILLQHHQLHVELMVDPSHRIGRLHPASLADIIMESAITTIADCEDSVAAIDVEDKITLYRNWLLLMKGELTATFEKQGQIIQRCLNKDRLYTAPGGETFSLPSRALLLVRNVGHLMTSEAVLDSQGQPIGEGLLDAAITVLCACHDLKIKQNSRAGSIYIVKPKMHGSREVAFACAVFATIEEFLHLPKNTIKIGIMDEERRTSTNLKNCLHAARERVFFINTGFLDRTGDEMHTSMQAGAVLPKAVIKTTDWLACYENRNVMIGLQCGLSGRAQIGKGMWTMPDHMAAMLREKNAQPQAGANCAWVPSPTAATLHALHYHQINVPAARQARQGEPLPPLEILFSMPVLDPCTLKPQDIDHEVENNAQSILGYVVRWIDQGIGCSKVPDINNIALMEDRATCRISAQLLANWLQWQIVSRQHIETIFKRMATLVDVQNRADPVYQPMATDFDGSLAFQAALNLVLQGAEQPCGYTEPILHHFRQQAKRRNNQAHDH